LSVGRPLKASKILLYSIASHARVRAACSVLGLCLITFIDAIMMNSQPLIGMKMTRPDR
jgi:hypothetical protein